LSQEYMYKYPA